MAFLHQISKACINWSIGFTVLIGLVASDYSGAATILALPISLFSITLSALSASSLPCDANYTRKRKFCDIFEFFKIWMEVLEILTASAVCARTISATIDYISKGRFREWFLGIQSHSLEEPWPDILGVSVIVVITALFMLGLETSFYFSVILIFGTFASCIFFLTIGGTHTVIKLSKWWEDLKGHSIQSILTASALSSYGFLGTFPKFGECNRKILRVFTFVFIPLAIFSSSVFVFTLMSHKELEGSATPLLRVFELRDVAWARLVMAIFIIIVISLALTEVLPSLFQLFVDLAGSEWQVFLNSLQYKSNLTGAPILAIFAAGSLAAILAFACPLLYLIKILNASTLLKCIFLCIQVIFNQYKPEFNNDSYLSNCGNTQYSKLRQSRSGRELKSRGFFNYVYCWKRSKPNSSMNSNRNRESNKAGTTNDKEYLLLNDYCDKSVDIILSDDSSDELSDRNVDSNHSSDIDEDSTDIDAVVQEYRERIQVATVDNFSENNKHPTFITTTIVAIFLIVIIISSMCLAIFIKLQFFNLLWISLIGFLLSSFAILLMPKNSMESDEKILPKSLIPICAVLALTINIVLTGMIIDDIWMGFMFWFGAGSLLFWKCDCCSKCDNFFSIKKNKVNIGENFGQYVDTILISR